jgi:hypothetical protein
MSSSSSSSFYICSICELRKNEKAGKRTYPITGFPCLVVCPSAKCTQDWWMRSEKLVCKYGWAKDKTKPCEWCNKMFCPSVFGFRTMHFTFCSEECAQKKKKNDSDTAAAQPTDEKNTTTTLEEWESKLDEIEVPQPTGTYDTASCPVLGGCGS